MRQTLPIILLAAAVLTGCASVKPLMDTSNAIKGPNLVGGTDEVLYEVATKGNFAVGYNLDHYKLGKITGGYRLTLLFKNNGGEELQVAPSVSLLDASGTLIPATSYEQFVIDASILAGTPAPTIPPPPPGVTRFNGTVFNTTTGQTSYVTGSVRPRMSASQSFASGFAQGAATGDAIVAAAKQRAGKDLLAWGGTNWLLNQYELEPGTQAVGVVFYPSLDPRLHPLKVRIRVGGDTFDFTSIN